MIPLTRNIAESLQRCAEIRQRVQYFLDKQVPLTHAERAELDQLDREVQDLLSPQRPRITIRWEGDPTVYVLNRRLK